jgi:hypothetical protein
MRGAALGLLTVLAACGRGGTAAPPSSPARAAVAPRNGLEVIGAMRRTYPSRALRSLAFSVRTVEPGSDAQRRSRVIAALPGRLRVANLPSSTRTGTVRNRQRLAVFERGRKISTLSRVDLAVVLAYDVYAQSIDTTIMWLDAARVRMGIARRDELDGRRVWVVGAAEGDDTSAQFWVDAERWRVVRVIQRDPRSARAIVDIRFTAFTEALEVPVPTRIEEYRGGQLVREQEISSVDINPALPAGAFDLARWRDVRLSN